VQHPSAEDKAAVSVRCLFPRVTQRKTAGLVIFQQSWHPPHTKRLSAVVLYMVDCRLWGLGFVQHLAFCSVNIRKWLQTEEENDFPLWGETWQYSSFSLVVDGSPPSPGEASQVGKDVSLLVFYSVRVDRGLSPLDGALPLAACPRAPAPSAPLSSLISNKTSFIWVVFFPSLQISVSPEWPYFQTPLKLTLQQLFADSDSWHLALLFIPLPLFHPWSAAC